MIVEIRIVGVHVTLQYLKKHPFAVQMQPLVHPVNNMCTDKLLSETTPLPSPHDPCINVLKMFQLLSCATFKSLDLFEGETPGVVPTRVHQDQVPWDWTE